MKKLMLLCAAALCFAALTFSMMVACVKLLGSGYSPMQVLLMRYVFGLAFCLPLFWREGSALWRTERPMGHVIRAIYGLLSTFAMFYAVTRMPIATATGRLGARSSSTPTRWCRF